MIDIFFPLNLKKLEAMLKDMEKFMLSMWMVHKELICQKILNLVVWACSIQKLVIGLLMTQEML